MQERDDEPRAAHPERVAERDRAAVHVHLLGVESELVDADEGLRGEGLVELDEIGIVGTAAAVANAVFNATGVRVRDLPIRPDRLIGRL